MYQIVYDFFITYLFAEAPSASWNIGGVDFAMGQWLSHTATIITLAILIVVAFKFVAWLVKVIGSVGQ